MTRKEYNGWTNCETWAANLWFDGAFEEQAQECFDAARADDTFSKSENATLMLEDLIKDTIEESMPQMDEASLASDLLHAALSEINYYEIAKHYIDSLAP